MKCRNRLSWFGLCLLGAGLSHSFAAQPEYKTPPKMVVDLLDRAPFPEVQIAPGRQSLLLVQRAGMPGIADLAQPRVRLAGKRFNPRNRGPVPGRRGQIVGMQVLSVADGSEQVIELPEGAHPGTPFWSPDGQKIAFVNYRNTGAELWVANIENGHSKRVSEPTLNPASGPCEWFPDSIHLLCRFRAEPAGGPPDLAALPTGPVEEDTSGAKAPVRTYQDLLSDAGDVRMYEYLLRSQLAVVSIRSGGRRDLGDPGIFGSSEISPGGQYLLLERVVPPYSYVVPESFFPREIEIWNLTGKKVFTVAKLPLAEAIPIGGVRTGPRSYEWKPSAPAVLVWKEALDEGDPKREVEYRDRLMQLEAPFQDEATALIRTQWRLSGLDWMADQGVFVSEADRDTQRTRTWLLDLPVDPARPARLLWERGRFDAYNDPGDFMTVRDASGRPMVLREGDSVFLNGPGGSPDGDHPVLTRLDLQTLESTELFRSAPAVYETVAAILDPGTPTLLTRHETRQDPPSYRVRNLADGTERTVTAFPDPAPELRGVTKELIRYWREDGIELSGTLYLPPGYQKGERLPLVMWAYPREYNDPDIASQVRGSSARFTRLSGASQLFFLTQGYAVLDGPAMPIVGKDGNDTFVEQLVMNARAAIDKVVAMGVADPRRIGIGGHSYGAFMAANLLAHSDLFAAGIARSGAYNRTLTPFGFQNERRTFWEAPEVYFTMSPFMHADRINQPLLLIHGQDDNNSGTFPMQSLRLFRAIQGLGGTARLVLLPREAHAYAARESILDVLAEMIDWFDRYVKNRPTEPASDDEP
ncbi:MAG: prolyl oligopeptidase family serine peptidase [Acidobacteriota bacterium]